MASKAQTAKEKNKLVVINFKNFYIPKTPPNNKKTIHRMQKQL
jgi:hypothetical protein